jgi:hypothetical protein
MVAKKQMAVKVCRWDRDEGAGNRHERVGGVEMEMRGSLAIR